MRVPSLQLRAAHVRQVWLRQGLQCNASLMYTTEAELPRRFRAVPGALPPVRCSEVTLDQDFAAPPSVDVHGQHLNVRPDRLLISAAVRCWPLPRVCEPSNCAARAEEMRSGSTQGPGSICCGESDERKRRGRGEGKDAKQALASYDCDAPAIA